MEGKISPHRPAGVPGTQEAPKPRQPRGPGAGGTDRTWQSCGTPHPGARSAVLGLSFPSSLFTQCNKGKKYEVEKLTVPTLFE